MGLTGPAGNRMRRPAEDVSSGSTERSPFAPAPGCEEVARAFNERPARVGEAMLVLSRNLRTPLASYAAGFLPRAACSARALHSAISAVSLNITRTPVPPWATRLPALLRLVLGHPFEELRILAAHPLELEHAGDLFFFPALDHGRDSLGGERVCYSAQLPLLTGEHTNSGCALRVITRCSDALLGVGSKSR